MNRQSSKVLTCKEPTPPLSSDGETFQAESSPLHVAARYVRSVHSPQSESESSQYWLSFESRIYVYVLRSLRQATPW